ncbi:hypothetical protein SYNPS1DRAFT_27417 [Syncephalis pseudoplumigaleata]|uniref:Uncharacterized protein n=1 Tax=Syncephalis pseudoplumigaleata TaxID=1712513 RepID=A0A4P9Z2Y7_9FUNG|nr:hypothetical protein SYNPS1DRAFT_27417 [Syncephalis pseudoplumigaleata]|eukprot:RKP26903.1 hypothetical protein SYNPS1DRAFT_27417 [Syncephalis pseudoplumigaleata]
MAGATAMPKPPMLHVLQSGGDVQVINVHFETHNDAHVLIKLLGFCVVVVLLLITVFVFFGNGSFLDSSLAYGGKGGGGGGDGNRSSISRMIFANYRSIAAAVWLIWYGIFCFWCWFARVAWGDITVPEKCVIGFRRVRERSVVCWLPAATATSSNAANGDAANSSSNQRPLSPASASVVPHWQLRIARPVVHAQP